MSEMAKAWKKSSRTVWHF